MNRGRRHSIFKSHNCLNARLPLPLFLPVGTGSEARCVTQHQKVLHYTIERRSESEVYGQSFPRSIQYVPSPRRKRKFRKDIHGNCSTEKRRVMVNRTRRNFIRAGKKTTQTQTSPRLGRVKEQSTIAADKLDERPEGRFSTTY